MNDHTRRFHELKAAADASGELPDSDREVEELEHLWNGLGQAFARSRSAGPELSLESHIQDEFGSGPARSSGRSLFVWSASLAAIITFTVMLFQIWTIRDAYREIQEDLRQMQTKSILASLQSDSAVDRLDGLLQVGNQQVQSDALVSAVLHRLANDSSINIRLASVRALGPYIQQPEVLANLRDAALVERSPLVLIGILDLIREADPKMAEHVLGELLEEGQLDAHLEDKPKPGTTNL